MIRSRGTVVVAADPFGNTPKRPYLLLSGPTHPFDGEQYIAVGITTTDHEACLAIGGAFEEGRLARESFVSPWAVVSLREENIDRAVGRLSEQFTAHCADELVSYVLGGRENS